MTVCEFVNTFNSELMSQGFPGFCWLSVVAAVFYHDDRPARAYSN